MLSLSLLLFAVLLVVVAVASAFGPAKFTAQVKKAVGIASLGFALSGPAVMPVVADGAVSASTVFRARTTYGAKIVDLAAAADSGKFDAFDNKKVNAYFDLFISGSNSLNSPAMKEAKKNELKIKSDIYAAVASKNAGALKSAYSEFIKVADLKSDYKPGELGQTDSSGYSPTWGTPRQYIYQR